ncbi:exonuclease domain-containing protein [Eisenibacter elegans]|jgi:DNA polymerase III epsilon subunit-like protein|uniref:3'-5' exonuclease n=1 Tax=Eisenibacter elegans TaxID=997 RepID=UPI0004238530|nr:exonuclease domain-containing protein [Eisenibacter elegans]
MSYIMVDIEADGPIPGEYSMIALGAVLVTPTLDKTFYAELRPISARSVPQALAVTGFTREQTLAFEDPKAVMNRFEQWVLEVSEGRPHFISDNNGFDWMFVCWYFHKFLERNPFGHSSSNLGSIYKGLMGSVFSNFKHLRKRAHTHNALDDALGNAEVLLELQDTLNLRINLS